MTQGFKFFWILVNKKTNESPNLTIIISRKVNRKSSNLGSFDIANFREQSYILLYFDFDNKGVLN